MTEHNAELIHAAEAVRDRLLAFVGAVAEMTDCGPDVDAITRLDAALARAKVGGEARVSTAVQVAAERMRHRYHRTRLTRDVSVDPDDLIMVLDALTALQESRR